MHTNRRLKVLIVHHARTLGGATTSLRLLNRQLLGFGYDVRIMLTDPTDTVLDYLARDKVHVVCNKVDVVFRHTTASWVAPLSPTGIIAQFRTLREADRACDLVLNNDVNWKPDIVHLNSVVLTSLVRPLRRRRVPTVLHVRESPINGLTRLRTGWMRRQIEAALPHVIFIGEHYQRAWLPDGGGQIVYNSVSEDFERRGRLCAHQKNTAAVGGPNDRIVFGFLGGVSEIKGSLPLLRVVEKLHAQNPRIRLQFVGMPEKHDVNWRTQLARTILPLVGGGTYWQNCMKQLARLGPIVDVTPFIDDLADVFERMHVLVFPATRDHFPRPIIEAAAFGVPVIASDLPSIRDVVVHRDTGILFRPNDDSNLLRAMQEIVAPGSRREMGIAAHSRYAARFTIAAATDSLKRVYSAIGA